MIEDDRTELREAFRGITYSTDEFERMFAIQTAMRRGHDILAESLDRGEMSPEQFLDRAQDNASAHFRQMRELLGPDRYREFFGMDETDNVLPVDRQRFLAQYE